MAEPFADFEGKSLLIPVVVTSPFSFEDKHFTTLPTLCGPSSFRKMDCKGSFFSFYFQRTFRRKIRIRGGHADCVFWRAKYIYMRYDQIDSNLFIRNREKFTKHLKPRSLAVFHSNDQMPRNGDQYHLFRQNSDLLYLSGADQEDSILVLFPDCPIDRYREVLFLKETSEHIAVWEGEKYTQERATEISGIKTVVWNDKFDEVFSMLVHYADQIYVNLNENDRAVNHVPYRDKRFAQEIRERFPAHKIERSGPIMSALRSVKEEIELQLMQKACDITNKAFRRVLGFVKPGVWEYEVEAEFVHEYMINRSNGNAYEPIIASGANACVLHYVENNKECKDGDLLLMDTGSDYANYASDMTRTIPVNGKFTERQKQVYEACLRVQKEGIDMLQPGITLNDYNTEVGKVMEAELIGLGLLDKDAVANHKGATPLYKKYFPHGTGHFIGLDTHDIGNRYEPLAENMVLTVEPGIYIREENIGIRIENNIVLRAGQNLDLMGDIPREVEEIEDLMNS